MQCGFYKLQDRLREEGWYLEWSQEVQGADAWEFMPTDHRDGPFKGQPIDEAKCLIALAPDLLEIWQSKIIDQLEKPAEMGEDEWADILQGELSDFIYSDEMTMYLFSETSGFKPDEQFNNDLQKLISVLRTPNDWVELKRAPDISPEALGGSYFMLSLRLENESEALENLKSVLPLFESCGCRYSEIDNDGVRIDWD
jgi:hypothetical protein